MKREKIAVRLLVGLISDYDYTKKVTISDIVKDAFKFTDELIKQAGGQEIKHLEDMIMCNSCKKYEMCRTFDVFHAKCNDYESYKQE